jgi:hypothetical protein
VGGVPLPVLTDRSLHRHRRQRLATWGGTAGLRLRAPAPFRIAQEPILVILDRPRADPS